MGSYLSEPVTEKVSTDESNDKLNCGSSSMQGWRISQEDAHNCLLDFDVNTALFAVYDGHGGHEVAHYCSQKLPDFIKDLQAYKDGDVQKALIEGFLGFDATIASRDVVAQLKELAGNKEADEESEEEENLHNLYEEAAMPIEQVIEKYTSCGCNPAVKHLRACDGDKFGKSPNLKTKKDKPDVDAAASSSTCCEASSSDKPEVVADSNGDGVSSSCVDSSECIAKTTEVNGDTPAPQIVITSSSSKNEADVADAKPEAEVKEATSTTTQNGEAQAKSDVITSSTTPVENGEISKKGKGKAIIKPKPTREGLRTINQIYSRFLQAAGAAAELNSDESTDEDDDDDADKSVNIEADNSDDDSEGDADNEEDEDDDDEEEEDEGECCDEEDMEFTRMMKEEPGSDSGCTAVVALLKDNELFVANAGDSRCIVCRNGKAIEMSFDHKPEDQPERDRVVKAGGKVTSDGRVNGGLNLSRAIGDHAYKQNKDLSDREQMITALPDVKTLTINPSEDEFMVLACDGIWNFMSSQEVVDFVRPRIEENPDKLSHICEEMFDHCLAPNTMGDGTGCDNMTAMIIQFKSNTLKRAASPDPAIAVDSKRAKTDAAEPQIDTTA